MEKRRQETSERPSHLIVPSSASQQGGKDGAESKQKLFPWEPKGELMNAVRSLQRYAVSWIALAMTRECNSWQKRGIVTQENNSVKNRDSTGVAGAAATVIA